MPVPDRLKAILQRYEDIAGFCKSAVPHRHSPSPTSPTSWLGTMKTLGFSFSISTTFCFREFEWAVSGQASPTVCVAAPLAWQRTCCVFQGHLWSEAPRLLIGCPTTLILRNAVRLPDLLCGIVDQALSAGHMPRNIQKDAPELAPPFDAIPDVCSGQTFEFGRR